MRKTWLSEVLPYLRLIHHTQEKVVANRALLIAWLSLRPEQLLVYALVLICSALIPGWQSFRAAAQT
jgi:hypothetical protein